MPNERSRSGRNERCRRFPDPGVVRSGENTTVGDWRHGGDSDDCPGKGTAQLEILGARSQAIPG